MKPLKEIDGELINHWYILALESEVPLNKPIKRWLYDTPYVLFRDKKGKVSALVDKCTHRSAQLSLGTVEGGDIRCPYHGWKYNGGGTLTEVPSDGPIDASAIPEKKTYRCAHKTPLVVQDGCVWIWPGDIAKADQGPSWRFPEFGNQKVTQYFMITDFDNEVTHLAQNFMDVPHTVFVHSKWFRNRSFLKVPIEVAVNNSRVKVTYQQTQDKIGFTEKVLNPRQEPMLHTDEFIFPNITRVDYQFGKKFFIINSQCSPISRYKTRVYTWIAYDIGTLSKVLKPFMSYYTRQVIQQDVDIMKNQGDNFKVFGEGDFKSTQADELHIAIDRMRAMGVQDRFEPATMNYVRERELWI